MCHHQTHKDRALGILAVKPYTLQSSDLVQLHSIQVLAVLLQPDERDLHSALCPQQQHHAPLNHRDRKLYYS